MLQDQKTRLCLTEQINQQIQDLLCQYLNQRPHLSLGSIAKKCKVSEPTLRRIFNGQIKTTPTPSTILNLLSYLLGTENINDLIQKTSDPLSTYIKNVFPQISSAKIHYDPKLNEELSTPVKYLIYKLASNRGGVSHEVINRLFGGHGEFAASELVEIGLILKKENNFFANQDICFALDPSGFQQKFRWASQYISQKTDPEAGLLNPLNANYSEKISVQSYKEIIKIQSKAMKKIREIIDADESLGEIPFLFLCAIDTLDNQEPCKILN